MSPAAAAAVGIAVRTDIAAATKFGIQSELGPGRPGQVFCGATGSGGTRMKQLNIGDVTITSIIERDGPWRKPEAG